MCSRSAQASRGEDGALEPPVACGDCATLHCHPPWASRLGATLLREQVVELREAGEKRLLAAWRMVAAWQHARLPLAGVVGWGS